MSLAFVIILLVLAVFVIGSVASDSMMSDITYPEQSVNPVAASDQNRMEMYDDLRASLARRIAADRRRDAAIESIRNINQG